MRVPDAQSEQRLDEMRRAAAAQPPPPSGSGGTADVAGYAGRPVLKAPVWTWEVPVYFFVGGAGGSAAVIAVLALLTGRHEAVAGAALWIAAAAGLVSPVLLTLDLGRRSRFLYMLRVFKWRSPMSVGAWVLAVFGTAAAGALVLLRLWPAPAGPLHAVGWLAALASALSGVVLATYTGVLLACTVIPVWNGHRWLLPVHMGASGLGSAAALLALMVPFDTVPGRLLLLAAASELVLGLLLEQDRRPLSRPLHHGRSGREMRAGEVLCGPVALLLVLALPTRVPAAICFLLGALAIRMAWIHAGSASVLEPALALAPRPVT